MLNEQAALEEFSLENFPEMNVSVNPMEIFPNVEADLDFTSNVASFDAEMMNADFNIGINEFQFNALNASYTTSEGSTCSPYSDINSAVSLNAPESEFDNGDLSSPESDINDLLGLTESKSKKVSKPRCSSRSSTASNCSSTSTKTLTDDKAGILKKLNLTPYQAKPRKQALSEIDASKIADPVEAKRAKNTESARRSRARKMQRMQELELKVSQLLEENELLKQKLANYE
ncbi:hypothetical protein FOG51_00216 [Hanseniaspora uvarum]|mgnify:CR=1 FL=1|nr:hypothetical protein FOG51_00216 [Hanseniaspora uvarum]KKA01730.1 General control protein HuGCN4 [Hanseniaspora uvarum DSM 2768]GMM43248.1 amino acid starvation-responsive transcription factor [Hanseniaspora uvarum]